MSKKCCTFARNYEKGIGNRLILSIRLYLRYVDVGLSIYSAYIEHILSIYWRQVKNRGFICNW